LTIFEIKELNSLNFEKEVLSSKEGYLVYYTTLSTDQDISKEYKYWSKITL